MARRKHLQIPTAQLRSDFWNAPENALLDRRTTAAGISRSVNWLEQCALRGGFIPYLKLGNRCLYRKADVLGWLASKGQLVNNTSELRRAAQ